MSFASALQPATLYSVYVDSIADCIGNLSTGMIEHVGIPEAAAEGDVLINEILFDPLTGGSRFIEIINTSEKFIDLSSLVVADIRSDTIAAYPVTSKVLLHPGAISAITAEPGDIIMQYPFHDADRIFYSDIPSFDRKKGNATVYSRQGIVLDSLDYDGTFHNGLISDPRGISLERVSVDLPTQSVGTWQSAAGSIGFATPGLSNSQQLPVSLDDQGVSVEPETFSPNGDGFDDFLSIRFLDPAPGSVANVRVFDATGREIAHPANNVSVGSMAVLTWEGDDISGRRVRLGAYVLLISLHTPEGMVTRWKRGCVVAEKL